MTSRDFAYWLQGYFEINSPTEIGQKETNIIKNHLNLVFKHEIDPSMGDKEHQDELNKIHNKPTLKELGEKHKFKVEEISYEDRQKHGNQPHPDWVLSSLHGWYDPKEGVPRC